MGLGAHPINPATPALGLKGAFLLAAAQVEAGRAVGGERGLRAGAAALRRRVRRDGRREPRDWSDEPRAWALSPLFIPLSPVFIPLSPLFIPLSPVCIPLSPVCIHLSPVCIPLSPVCIPLCTVMAITRTPDTSPRRAVRCHGTDGMPGRALRRIVPCYTVPGRAGPCRMGPHQTDPLRRSAWPPWCCTGESERAGATRDWARRCHVCAATSPATSAPRPTKARQLLRGP